MKDIIDVLKSVFAQIKGLPTKRRAKVLAAGLVIATLLLIGGAIGGAIALRNTKDSEMAQTLSRIQQAHQAELDAKQAQIASLEGSLSQLQAQIASTPPTLTPAPTLTPLPTATFAPTPTSTPTPIVQVKITSPVDGQNVSVNPEVDVEYRNIPADRHLWIAVRIPHVRPAGLIYPQLKEMKLSPQLIGTGIYKTFAALGAREDIGKSFNIITLLADEEANQLIVAYAKACSFNVNSCTGMPLPERGIDILDFVTVFRQ